MRIFFAGATGVIGRPLLPLLVAAGHEVTALTRSAERAAQLRAQGALASVADVRDAEGLARAVREARPDAVIHQLTDLPRRIDPRKTRQQLASTNRLRRETTRVLWEAAAAVGATRFVAQSISFIYRPGSFERLCSEDEPLYLDARDDGLREMVEAVAAMDEVLRRPEMVGISLRYGAFYGPGTVYARDGSFSEDVVRRRIPIVGQGTGVFSFIHVADAATATLAALQRGAAGAYHVVDDHPVPIGEWLPVHAELLRAPRPWRIPGWMGALGAGRYAMYLLRDQRGVSNAKARSELGWSPHYTSWKDGFAAELGGPATVR